MNLPVVAVVGRPNVGKSHAVQPHRRRAGGDRRGRPGVTRDRKEVEAEWLGVPFLLVDTGGWLPGGDDARRQGQPPGRAGDARRRRRAVRRRRRPSASPRTTTGVADWLRRHRAPGARSSPTRSTTTAARATIWEFLALGLGDPCPVSALHGRGTGDLLDERGRAASRRRRAPSDGDRLDDDESSRPATGVSARRDRRPAERRQATLFNRLIGDDRSVVHDMPGTTRDAIDTRRRDRRRADRVRRHRRDAPHEPRSTTAPSTTRSSGRCGRSTTPTSRCS